MSLNVVDDLQAAEDHAEVLREHARKVVEEWERLSPIVRPGLLKDEMRAAVRQLDTVSRGPFVRPTCEDGRCDDDCGGWHPATVHRPEGTGPGALAPTAAGRRWACLRCGSQAVEQAPSGERTCRACGLGPTYEPPEEQGR